MQPAIVEKPGHLVIAGEIDADILVYQQRVPVTVCRYGNNMLIISTGFTFQPEFLP